MDPILAEISHIIIHRTAYALPLSTPHVIVSVLLLFFHRFLDTSFHFLASLLQCNAMMTSHRKTFFNQTWVRSRSHEAGFQRSGSRLRLLNIFTVRLRLLRFCQPWLRLRLRACVRLRDCANVSRIPRLRLLNFY